MEKVVVLGGGESGCGAAVLAQQKGFSVFLSDNGKIKEKYKNVLTHNAIEWEEETHSEERFFKADLIVKSPGIPDTIPLILDLKNASIPIISEIEFAAQSTSATLIGITGTNGKTTTAMMTYEILKKSGFHVGLAGNIGSSFAKQVAEEDFVALATHGFSKDDIWDIAGITALFALSNRMASITGMRPNDEFYQMGRGI